MDSNFSVDLSAENVGHQETLYNKREVEHMTQVMFRIRHKYVFKNKYVIYLISSG